jgi:hypothetical protein
MIMASRSLLLLLVLMPALSFAAPTEILPLSGMGHEGESPVQWEFRLDSGRGSGEWSRIVVPSCWEQQGFGRYYYGTQGRGKPDDDPVIPKETGIYKRGFELPDSWRGREVHIVFEAAMTDTSVFVNGSSAGPTHQGGFYRFSYDITKLVKIGTNEIEVRVSKESANASVNHAERRGDYWTFGGIYRPVWLEARPRHHIAWTAIDARADGRFTAQVHFDEPMPRNARVVAQLFDHNGAPAGTPMTVPAGGKDQVTVTGTLANPSLWSAETPNLYTVKWIVRRAGQGLHERVDRFGFRTLEVRANDGVYLNGRKIVLKGINRHSFRPASGRTLTRAENYADARLIKSANMNAVRMSHYPPDPAFLDAADELGLYVLDELAGWQGYYDTPTGARLIGQIVRRDVNHPSILFWDNGNEGGWNTENDGEFAKWDPQRRPVLHPWAVHDDINTDHYENYDSTVRLSKGPQIFMPTEFLHGLYDGGIGAGFRDYWDVMSVSPTVAGGFFWAFADEGIERTDRERRIDNVGNAAPDGMFGPHLEKEGSFHAVREIWSPVLASGLRVDNGRLHLRLRNAHDFIDLERCAFSWRVRRMPAPGSAGKPQDLTEGRLPGPRLPARQEMDWSIPLSSAPLTGDDVLELTAHDANGAPLWTWTLPGEAAAADARPTKKPRISASGRRVTAGDYVLEFDEDGTLRHLSKLGREISLRGPTVVASLREQREFKSVSSAGTLRMELAPRAAKDVIARMTWSDGTLRSLTWRLDGEEIRVAYELEPKGEMDIFGIRFDYPREAVLAKRWLGAGPYRVWKNRQGGTQYGLHETASNDPIPGETFQYPEFPGFFGPWRWLEMQTRESPLVFRNVSGIPWFGVHRPQPGQQPVIVLPDLGWSFLHAIPPIGTKFDLPETLGPQSQTTRLEAPVRGEIGISVTAR